MSERIYLLLGAKYEQIPLIEAAQNRGLRTLAFDFNRDPAGRAACDEFYNVSYMDEERIVETVRGRVVAGVGTIGSNDAICIVSRLNQRLGLRGIYDSPAVIERANYKFRWKPFLLKKGITGIPRGFVFRTYAQVLDHVSDFQYPLLFKPSDSSGSKGVTVLCDRGGLRAAFNKAHRFSRNQTIIVEAYIGENSFAVESFVRDGVVRNLVIANRKIASPPITVGLGLTLPADLDSAVEERMLRLNMQAIGALGIKNGPVHMDMVLDPEGTPYIVDIGPRLIGGPAGWTLIHQATGFDVLEAVLDLSLGRQIEPIQLNSNGTFCAHRYITTHKAGVIEQLIVPEKLHSENITKCEIFVKTGDSLYALDNASHRFGYVTARETVTMKFVTK